MIITQRGVTMSSDPNHECAVWLTVNGASTRIVGKGQLQFVIEGLRDIAAHFGALEREANIDENGASLGYTDDRQDSLPFTVGNGENPNDGHG